MCTYTVSVGKVKCGLLKTTLLLKYFEMSATVSLGAVTPTNVSWHANLRLRLL